MSDSALQEAMHTIHTVSGRFVSRGHAGFEYDEISEALAIALQELSLILRLSATALNDTELSRAA